MTSTPVKQGLIAIAVAGLAVAIGGGGTSTFKARDHTLGYKCACSFHGDMAGTLVVM